MRIAYFVHGRGWGHANRALAAVPVLRADGHEVEVFASAEALDALAGLAGVTPVAFCDRGRGAARQLAARVRSDYSQLRARAPEVVISDGDPGGALAGRSLGLPVVSVGHGLVFRHCRLPDAVTRTLAGARDWVRASANTMSSDVWATHHVPVHFLPIEARRASVTVARPDPRLDLRAGEPDRADPFVLAYFSAGDGADVLDALSDRGQRVICFGEQARTPRAAEVRARDRQAFVEHLGRCRAIVCSAGSNLLAEAIGLGRPVCAVYPEDHHEQRLNALLVEAAGVGEAASLSRPGRDLDRFLVRLEADGFDRIDLAAALPAFSPTLAEVVARLGQG